MKMIKVTNKVEEVNRLKLEKLGLSTKRDIENTIGQFGSGIKFAPIAAVRKGMRFVFAGNDKAGKYLMEYVVKDEDGIPSIYYKYDDYEKPSSFTADAGVISWGTDFQIYREIIANAMDEAKISGFPWTIEVVDEDDIKAEDGYFSVYLSSTPEMSDITENFDKYFSTNRVPVYENKEVKLYEPIDDELRIYCKGVLVYCSCWGDDEERFFASGLFDYEINTLSLNEERTIKSIYELEIAIVRAILTIDDKKITDSVIKKILEETASETYYEFLNIGEYAWENSYISSLHKPSWVDTYNELYSKNMIIKDENATVNYLKTIRAMGYEPIVISGASRYSFLNRSGFPKLNDVDDFELKYTVEKDLSAYPVLRTAIQITTTVYPEIKEVENLIYVYKDEDGDGTLGFMLKSNDGTKAIYIEQDYASNGGVESLISTIIHEYDHYSSGISDGNMDGRMFREVADKRLGQITYGYWLLIQQKLEELNPKSF